ncbi:MAG TPA: DUF58 domain-containing protein [Anaerolineae bacterium]|nr:DUF58 domain-containing protein [Anaerolineae bacterium]
MKRSGVVFLLWAVVLLAALNTGRDLYYHLTYVLSITIVLSFLWTWGGIHWVELERRTRSRRSQVGRVVEERFAMRNTGFFPKLWLEVRDHSDLPGHYASRVVSTLGAFRQRGWTVKTVCRRRGRFTLGPITLTSGDPFGLFKMPRHLSTTSTMIVYPATVELPAFAPPLGQLPGGEAMRRRTHYVTTNVAGVREYAPGDSFNRIHWLSTARTGRLIVKEFELDPTADVWLFLDMQREVQTGSAWETVPTREGPALLWKERPRLELDPTTEEYGVTIAASLARHFIRLNRAVGLVAYGQHREVAPADRGDRQLTKLLETLAVIQARGRIPIGDVVAVETSHFSRDTTAVVVTPSTDEGLADVLRSLGRRGIRAIVVLIEASTFGPAESSLTLLAELIASDIPAYLVKCGQPLEEALSQTRQILT